MNALTRITLVLLLSLCSGLAAMAHSGSTSYLLLTETEDRIDLAVSMDLADLEYALGVDADGNGELTWGELRATSALFEAHVRERVRLRREESDCAIAFNDLKVDEINGSPFAVLYGGVACPGSGALDVRSNLMFDLDAGHRTLIEWSHEGRSDLAVLTSALREWRAEPQSNALTNLLAFAREGMLHIWSGLDHLAFLLILLLPVCISSVGAQRAIAWRKLIFIVSAFTLAHSITLALAVTGVLQPPARPIEVAIAASVTIAALTNLIPKARSIGAMTAFAFGLLHGFGFASALEGLGASKSSFATALAGFNLGVEAGQLIVVAAACPILIWLRAYPAFAMRFLHVSSLLVATLGVVWVVERAIA